MINITHRMNKDVETISPAHNGYEAPCSDHLGPKG